MVCFPNDKVAFANRITIKQGLATGVDILQHNELDANLKSRNICHLLHLNLVQFWEIFIFWSEETFERGFFTELLSFEASKVYCLVQMALKHF